jgi:hypothetical protein
MTLELKFSDLGECELFKKLELQPHFPFSAHNLNDEFRTAEFQVTDQADADSLECGLLDELEPRSYVTYSFQSI